MKPLYTELEYQTSKSTDKLPCECYHCGTHFYTLKTLITQELKLSRGRIKYCTTTCLSQSKTSNSTNTVLCKNCGESFIKKISQIKKTSNNFCSRSCSSSFNNKARDKKEKIVKPKKEKLAKFNYLIGKTKSDMFDNYKWQNARSCIQKHARYIYNNSNKNKCCSVCGYEKHFEVAHIKSVSSFDNSTNIVDGINNIDNRSEERR